MKVGIGAVCRPWLFTVALTCHILGMSQVKGTRYVVRAVAPGGADPMIFPAANRRGAQRNARFFRAAGYKRVEIVPISPLEVEMWTSIGSAGADAGDVPRHPEPIPRH